MKKIYVYCKEKQKMIEKPIAPKPIQFMLMADLDLDFFDRLELVSFYSIYYGQPLASMNGPETSPS